MLEQDRSAGFRLATRCTRIDVSCQALSHKMATPDHRQVIKRRARRLVNLALCLIRYV
jgi:hypothetical protein